MQLLFPLIGINNSWTAVVIARPPTQSKLLPISPAEFPSERKENSDQANGIMSSTKLVSKSLD